MGRRDHKKVRRTANILTKRIEHLKIDLGGVFRGGQASRPEERFSRAAELLWSAKYVIERLRPLLDELDELAEEVEEKRSAFAKAHRLTDQKEGESCHQ